jgi:hypothetical protein
MALLLFIMVMFDLSVLVKYITRFTEESFALLIGMIYVVEAFEKLFQILDDNEIMKAGDVERYCYCQPRNLSHGHDMRVNDTLGNTGLVNTTGKTVTASKRIINTLVRKIHWLIITQCGLFWHETITNK